MGIRYSLRSKEVRAYLSDSVIPDDKGNNVEVSLNLIGHTFGRFTVLRLYDRGRYLHGSARCIWDYRWVCQCACGHEETRTTRALIEGLHKNVHVQQCRVCTDLVRKRRGIVPEKKELYTVVIPPRVRERLEREAREEAEAESRAEVKSAAGIQENELKETVWELLDDDKSAGESIISSVDSAVNAAEKRQKRREEKRTPQKAAAEEASRGDYYWQMAEAFLDLLRTERDREKIAAAVDVLNYILNRSNILKTKEAV